MAFTFDESTIKHSPELLEVDVNGKKIDIYTEQASPANGSSSKLDVLFLHGMRFTSQNWLDIKSVYLVASWGYRAVAVDLPGFGKSTKIFNPEDSGAFLEALIKTLGLDRPVIVSPSMSGQFSMPYIFSDGSTAAQRARGYVPVAPVNTENYVEQYKKSQIPTLLVYGTKDETPMASEGIDHLQNIPGSERKPMQEAGHACYLDKPDEFHQVLQNFLQKLV